MPDKPKEEVVKYKYYTWRLELQRDRDLPGYDDLIVADAIHKISENYKNLTPQDISTQTIYIICNHRGFNSSTLGNMLERFDLEYEYNGGFAGDTFEPEMYLDEMNEILSKNPEILEEATKLVKIKRAMQYFNLNGDLFKIAKLVDIINEQPHEGVYLSMKQEQFHKCKDKDLREFYAALKSLSGCSKYPYFEISKSVLIARVMGFTKDSEIPQLYKASPFYQKYSKKYHIDKMILALCDHFGVKTAWCGRKLAVTVQENISQEQLNKWAASRVNRRKNKPGGKNQILSLIQSGSI